MCLVILSGLFYVAVSMPIHNIYIKGNHIVSDEEIIRLAELDDYPSFLLTSSSDVRKKIIKNQYIEEVVVKKEFGNVITITIDEYQPIALTKDRMIILSNGLKIDNQYDLSDIPVLINTIENKDIYQSFAKKFGRIRVDILRQISEIEYSPVEVDTDRFLLYMNDGNLVYVTLTKIEKINRYNDIKDKLENRLGTIYLDAGDYVELRK